ncbi:MAG TPA: OmpA family protein [Gemmatimonadales bacterium]|jgi:outer membrane protein OmpA-like peptidoglycan-associated protein
MSLRIRLSVISTLLLAGLALGGAPSTAEAQFGKRLKDAVKRSAEDKAIQKATEEENKAIDDAVAGGGEESAAADETAAAAADSEAAATDTAPASEAAPATAPATGTATAPAKPKNAGEGAFVNFDFVPGDRVLFYDDYSGDNVGDFPRRLEFAEGNADVAEWEGAKWLRVVKSSKFAIPLPETLPERFTIEFDFVTNHTASNGWPIMLNASGSDVNWESQGTAFPTVRFSYREGGVYVGKIESESPVGDQQNKVTRARIMVDGKYTKVYMNGVRVANAPNADLGRSNKVQLWVPGYDAEGVQATLIGPVRVAAGGKKLYDALAEKGRVATQGIYFDTGSDAIRQESAPTLKEIGTMLKEHPELKLTIEGHTDNVGKAESNQALSEKRAAAVRQYLLDNYQVDGARLEATGLGQTKPVASNETAEGRQQNRRVELVKR